LKPADVTIANRRCQARQYKLLYCNSTELITHLLIRFVKCSLILVTLKNSMTLQENFC